MSAFRTKEGRHSLARFFSNDCVEILMIDPIEIEEEDAKRIFAIYLAVVDDHSLQLSDAWEYAQNAASLIVDPILSEFEARKARGSVSNAAVALPDYLDEFDYVSFYGDDVDVSFQQWQREREIIHRMLRIGGVRVRPVVISADEYFEFLKNRGVENSDEVRSTFIGIRLMCH